MFCHYSRSLSDITGLIIIKLTAKSLMLDRGYILNLDNEMADFAPLLKLLLFFFNSPDRITLVLTLFFLQVFYFILLNKILMYVFISQGTDL